ncbi:hypothetical protein [Novosphingobium album (ex Hu et al. 2023)]|uniref:Uncharacterized protein n=1 Tax=Novosphingobium album (ex Hu et al. 2023) TaxID=2930093 RepID=A0ABT0B5R1_9SPHN|nr:hypothetical protein [Novosphingobium album (ex Hu et al. 2023)]MCJ2180385.1 hypothetical protein [Novosphingobium album (ex Hu et al. 2023)]
MNFFLRYEQAINWIVGLCPQPDKFAHTYAGLLIWLFAGLALRRPLHSVWTLVPVVVLELANEMVDRITHGSWAWHDTLRDMAATWFWPFVLLTCFRLFPVLTSYRPPGKAVLAPSAQNEIEGALPPMAPMRAPDGHDVRGVLAGSEPV